MIRKADLEHMFRKTGPIHPQQQQPPPQYSQAQMQAQQRAEQERREKMRRLAMAPTDKNLPDGIEDICIGDSVQRYRELQEVERQLDATMMRKKLEATDTVLHPPTHRYGTMRIWISNTAENQPWQGGAGDGDGFDFDSGTNPTYRVKVQGRLLPDDTDRGLDGDNDDENDADADAMDEDPKEKLFSQFFTSITADFDRPQSLQPDKVEWKRPEASSNVKEFSELCFKRKGDENVNITINLQRLQQPERYRLSKGLSELLDTDEEDRTGALMGVWEYARSQHLQQEDDERKFACDAKLKALFNQDSFYFPTLPHLLKPHFSPLPPVRLPYTIRVDKDYISPSPESGIAPSQPTIYDVQVSLDDPLQPLLRGLLRPKNAAEDLEKIRAIDEQLVLIMGAISQSKAKHAFFTSMAKDPVAFTKRWLSSQKRDLEVILGDSTRGGGDASGEEWQHGGADGVWGSDVAKESVALWLARQGILQKGH